MRPQVAYTVHHIQRLPRSPTPAAHLVHCATSLDPAVQARRAVLLMITRQAVVEDDMLMQSAGVQHMGALGLGCSGVAASQPTRLACDGAGLGDSTQALILHGLVAYCCCSMVSCHAEAIKGSLVLLCQEVLPTVKAGLALQCMQRAHTTS